MIVNNGDCLDLKNSVVNELWCNNCSKLILKRNTIGQIDVQQFLDLFFYWATKCDFRNSGFEDCAVRHIDCFLYVVIAFNG